MFLVLVAGFPVGPLRANCYLLAPEPGGGCVVVDAGQGAAGPVEEALRTHRLTPAGVLATHGHPDHVADASALAARYGVSFWLHPGDHAMLPAGQRARELPCDLLELGGVPIAVTHTPGHTNGSVTFRVDSEQGGRIALTGDTLFAGSIGRTENTGGGPDRMRKSLCDLMSTLGEDTVVLPGHGPATTIGRERAANPVLAAGAGWDR